MKIYYDGICKMCTGFISLAKRFSKPRTFDFCPLQNADFEIPTHFNNTVIVKTADGKILVYTEAISLVLDNMFLPFRIVNILLKISPKSIRNKGYVFIAKNRYQWFGKHETCQVIK
jgi:predicted DCC family thiol-disulfide oxidoreductase YuxK